METKYLPAAVVATALPQLQRAIAAGDPTAFAAIKEWGFESIARVYDPDPLLRPHHYLLKKFAETEWRRMLEHHERRLKEILLQKTEEAWAADLDERILDRRHQHQEARRRDSLGWDKGQRIDELTTVESFRTDEQIRLAKALREINGPTDGYDGYDPTRVAREMQAEIAAVENDPSLTNEQRHRRIEAIQRSFEAAKQRPGR